MSFDTVLQRALKEGTGVSLSTVKRSKIYREELERLRGLPNRHPVSTHRGIALRGGPLVFGHSLNLLGEKQALQEIRGLKHLRESNFLALAKQESLIHVLGQRLISAAIECISPTGAEMAQAFGRAKTAEQQISLLKGLETHINQARQKPKEDKAIEPNKYHHFDYYFQAHKVEEFLPAQFKNLDEDDVPNCLGMSILLSAWARLAGAHFYFTTEIIQDSELESQYMLAVYDALLGLLSSLKGDEVKIIRKRIKTHRQAFERSLQVTRDWHHGIAIQLLGGRWFYLDPYAELAELFPDEWRMKEVDRLLRKYGDVVPGLSIAAHDHHRQASIFERKFKEFTGYMGQAYAAKYKLAVDPGIQTAADIVAVAPEIQVLCRLLARNTPVIRRRVKTEKLNTAQLVYWLLYAWDFGFKETKLRPLPIVRRMSTRFKKYPAYRRKKLDDLVAQFAEHIRLRAKDYKDFIHPALDIGRPETTIGLTVLSNLASWIDDDLPGTLLLEHGNGQMFWHEALSPLPETEKLSEKARSALAYGEMVLKHLPKHRRTILKIEAIDGLLDKKPKPREEIIVGTEAKHKDSRDQGADGSGQEALGDHQRTSRSR
jgi:hypothetical protein